MTEVIPKKMARLNSSVDVIPIQGSSNEDSPKFLMSRRNNNMNRRNHSRIRDPSIIERVKEYLVQNEDKVYIDVAEMAVSLKKQYSRDYKNRKDDVFKELVRRAYDAITESFSRNSDVDDIDDIDDIDDEENDEEEDVEVEIQSDSEMPSNDLSDRLMREYKKTLNDLTAKNGSDKELIDISSDDDNDNDNNSTTVIESTPNNKIKQMKNHEISLSAKSPLTRINHNCLNPKIKASSTKTFTPDVKAREATVFSSNNAKVNDKVINDNTDKCKKRSRDKSADSTGGGPILKKKKEIGTPSLSSSSSFAITPQEKKYKFCDIGINDNVLDSLCRLLLHIKHPELFKQIGSTPPRGILLHGPPGCGKSLLAHTIAGELDIPYLKIAAPQLIAGVSGESESRVRDIFDQAVSLAPCVLFLDEIDAIAPNRANVQREMERRIVAQLLSCLDELNFKENGNKVLILGATNRPEAIDPALRRAGRFDREVSIGIPDKECRAKILEVHLKNVTLSDDVDILKIAAQSPGYVGADLVSLISEAGIAAVERAFKSLVNEKKQLNNTNDISIIDNTNTTSTIIENVNNKETKSTSKNNNTNDLISTIKLQKNTKKLSELLEILHNEIPISDDNLKKWKIEYIDFEIAFKVVQPSSKREGFATVPDVTWNDIGSLKEIREELQMAILAPVKYSDDFKKFGLTTPTGVLLCGPPGCGKTLLAKAIANEAEINFISVKGPELLNMYVGESEKAVRQCFIRARDSAPCVIFFDEIDALCPKRSDGDNSSTSRIVNQLLTEMDGVEGRKGVYLMAATNRPDIIDPAVMRPGRFDKILYVGLPTPDDRVDILRALTKNGTVPKFSDDISIEDVGKSERCNGYTGADLAGLVRESSTAALKESMANSTKLNQIYMRHIDIAFTKIRPSVHEKEAKNYEKLRKQYTVMKPKVVENSVKSTPEISKADQLESSINEQSDNLKDQQLESVKNDEPELSKDNQPEPSKSDDLVETSKNDESELSKNDQSNTSTNDEPETSKNNQQETLKDDQSKISTKEKLDISNNEKFETSVADTEVEAMET
ncbi:hypothetical protein HCN44_007564 [Aphidius gifuensis]|uniref:AAA+ ATPase domain-containing protein n=1 Tax=Aphidius gifuensis TaxID=684658 RepID=A0A835CPG8_APHGI|nr:nuclear valosin-containing protein-like [Aphidius gifuensis]KAF7988070.1 hypothetical protein HCN44_007564 [Aphidius gifuensis]